MPISTEKIAKTTGFQSNCGLNCLAHVLVKNIDRVPRGSFKIFLKQFNDYYHINLNVAQFKAAITQIENSVHREIILGPVLRAMLGKDAVLGELAEENRDANLDQPDKPLFEEDILALANFFGIRIESYQSGSQLELLGLSKQALQKSVIGELYRYYHEEEPANPLILKIHQQASDRAATVGHFQYEEETEATAKAHNVYYEDRFPYNTTHAKEIRERIKKSGQSKKPEEIINFSKILTEYEKEHGARQSRGSADQANPFAEFSKLFGGEGFSTEVGKGIFQAFAAPFVDADGEPDLGFKSSSDGWMGIFEGIIQFGFKIFQMMQGLTSVMGGIFSSMQPQQNSGEAADTDDMSGMGERFAAATGAFNKAFSGEKAEDGWQPPSSMTSQFDSTGKQQWQTLAGDSSIEVLPPDGEDEEEDHGYKDSDSSSRPSTPNWT